MKKIILLMLFVIVVFHVGVVKAQVPGAPTNLVVTPLNTGGTIQFTAPASDGGSAITNYEYSIDNGATWVTPSPAITSSPLYISSGLTNCTSYQVKIRAVNAAGSGTASTAVQLIPVPSVNIGVQWTQRTSASNNDWNSVTYGNGLFVAVSATGAGNRVMTSPDGITWTSRTSAVDNDWTSVTYGNGLFVAVAQSGTGDRVMTSPDGINWTAQTSAEDNGWRSVTYGNGLFVAVALDGNGNLVMTSPDGISWTARTSATDNWSSVTYGNGLFVAVAFSGGGNLVMTSPDGINWSPQTSVEDNKWNSVTYGNGLFVAVSSSETGNQVMTSPDGITWTAQHVANRGVWAGVTYGNGLFVAVANDIIGNKAIISPDGINWSNGAFPATTYYSSVTYGNGIFVVVSNRGAGTKVITSDKVADAPVITAVNSRNNGLSVSFTQANSVNVSPILNYEYSTDNGNTWVAHTSSTSPITISGLTIGTAYNVKLRAINAAGTSCASSAFLATPALGTVADAPTNLVITPINTGGIIEFTPPVNDGGSDISNYQYSTDNGSTWITPSPAIRTNRIVINSGLINCTTYQLKLRAVNDVGVGAESSVQLIPAAVDVLGASWTSRTSAVNNDWQSVTYGIVNGNGLFVAVANTGTNNRIMTSANGIDWTISTPPANNNWFGVTYGNGLFVAVSANGSPKAMYSANGIDWTLGTTPAVSNQWVSVTYGNGLFVAVSRSGSNSRVMTSPNGINWTLGTSTGTDKNWQSVTYGNGLFVAVSNTVGIGNQVMTSPDGTTWTIRTSAADNGWNSVTYGNGLFVAVAQSGTGNRVMTSPDGITWTARSSAADISWKSVTYGNGLFVAVALSGNNNRVMTSYDGITWTSRTSAADNGWNSVTYGNNLFVSVSSSGVMTSSFASATDAPVITSAIMGSTSTLNFTQSGPVNASATSNYEYSTDNGSNWVAVSPAATTSPLSITSLSGSANSIMLRAVNSVGSSCPSNNFFLPPTATAQTLCGSKTLADLVATGTDLKWYDVATNGSALASTIAITSGTYYVTQTLNNNESDRTSVAVTVNPSAVTSSAIKLSNASVHVTILPSLSNNWSVSGGLDQGLFSISNNTMLNFNNVANYNSTSSNVYLVNISNGCTTINLTITISPFCGKWD